MELLVQAVILVLGLAVLVRGADVFVDYSCRIARCLGISELAIGLTLVALGTSLPELAVSLVASLGHMHDLSVANVVGSNIYNVLVVVGINCLLVGHVVKNRKIINRDAVWVLSGSIMLTVLAATGGISRHWGVIFLGMYLLYMYSLYSDQKGGKRKREGSLSWKMAGMCLFAIVAIWAGGQATVNAAVQIASMLGIERWVIGATIIAMGTSFPETVTSLVAIKRGKVELSMGNILGSNAFNIFVVLGLASVISPIAIDLNLVAMDFMVMLGSAVFVTLLMIKGKMGKTEGALALLLYSAYVAMRIL